MQLSPHFALSELVHTATGLPNEPDEAVVEHLRVLCRDVLEPTRTLLGVPLRVNSGYRSAAVNQAVHGNPHSQHLAGDAADVVPINMTAEEAMARIAREVEAGRLPHLDQAIIYDGGGFLHLSTSAARPRQQLLRSASGGGSGGPYTAYRA